MYEPSWIIGKRTWTYWTILWACFCQKQNKTHLFPLRSGVLKNLSCLQKTENDKSVGPNHVTLTVPRCKDSRYCGGQVCAFGPTVYIWVCPASFFTGNTFKFPVEICKFFCQSRMVASCVLCVFYGKVTVRLVFSFSRSFKNYIELLDGLKNSLCQTLPLMFHMAPLFPSTLQSASCLLFITLWQWYHGNKRSAFLGGTYQIFHDVSEPVGHKIRKKTIFWNARQYIPTWSKSKTTKDIHWPWKQSDTMMYAMRLEYGKIPKFSQSIELQRTQCCDSLAWRSLVKTDRANLTIFRGLHLWKLRWEENQEIMQ